MNKNIKQYYNIFIKDNHIINNNSSNTIKECSYIDISLVNKKNNYCYSTSDVIYDDIRNICENLLGCDYFDTFGTNRESSMASQLRIRISEVDEAYLFSLSVSDDLVGDIDNSNNLFCESVNKFVDDDLNMILESYKSENNKIINFNNKRIFIN